MGAFNTVSARTQCPNCGVIADFEVRFKFGDTWQHHYRVGDMLRWGGNDIGRSGLAEVLVEAIGGPCPACGADGLDFDVRVIGDRVVSVDPAPVARPEAPEGYVVVEK